jgi:hypothetical protein
MSNRKKFLLVLVIIAWAALVIQLILHLQNSVAGTPEALSRFFSFFTILTNLLVAVYITNQLLNTRTYDDRFFSRPGVQTAITLYIFIVGLIYNLLLRNLWTSGGLQAVIHDVLHSFIPIMMLIYWWIYTDARHIAYKAVLPWLIYPFVYAVYVFIYGHFMGWYPYPFLNVSQLGYPQALINGGAVLASFLLFALVFVFAGKRKGTRNVS